MNTELSIAVRQLLRKPNYILRECATRPISSEKSTIRKPILTKKLRTSLEVPFTLPLKSLKDQITTLRRAVLTNNGIFVKLVTHDKKHNIKNYVEHLYNLSQTFTTKFPKVMESYRILYNGAKLFMADMKKYLHVLSILHNSSNGVYALNRQQLQLYMKMPRDIYKLTPIFVSMLIPIIGTVFLPFLLKHPNDFLTPHFLTEAQRADFEKCALQARVKCYKALLMHLRAKLPLVENHDQYEQLKLILSLIGCGLHLNAESIIAVKEIFMERPYKLSSLSNKHLRLLMRTHGLQGFFKVRCLKDHAVLLHNIDLAILQEGDLRNMKYADLQDACSIRGLNPEELLHKDLVDWLSKWLKISTMLKDDHVSLYLHLPLLLGYNHTNNWRLLNWNRQKSKI